jgi:bacterioferritin
VERDLKRHHLTAAAPVSSKISEAFLVLVNEESAHADRLAQRIVQLGDQPEFSLDSLIQRSYALYEDSPDLETMIQTNPYCRARRDGSYRHLITLICDKHSTTRRPARRHPERSA